MTRSTSPLSLRTVASTSVEQTPVDETTTTTPTGTGLREQRKDDTHRSHGHVNEEDAVCLLCYDPFDGGETGDCRTNININNSNSNSNSIKDTGTARNESTSVAASARGFRNDETVEDLVDLEVGSLSQGSPTSLSSMVPTSTSTTSTAAKTKRVRLGTCSHSFCQDCLNDYFRYMIRSHQVPIPCPTVNNPHPNSCGNNPITKNEVVPASGSYSTLGHTDRGLTSHVSPQIVYQVLLASASPATTTTATNATIATTSYSSFAASIPALRWFVLSPEEDDGPTQTTTDGSSLLEAQSENPNVGRRTVDNATTMIPSTAGLDDPDWMKFVRLHRLYHNPSLIACTQCPALIEPTSATATSSNAAAATTAAAAAAQRNNPVVVCPSCQHTFCTIHGDVHVGQSCHEYLSSPQYLQQQRTEQILVSQQRQKNAKPCSHCGMWLSKQGGCDHILCPMCHNDMCYHCGTHVYLSGKVIRSCAQCRQGFVDHRYEHQYRCRLLLCVPFLLPGWLLYSLITLCLAVISGCFCGCFMCGWTDDVDSDDNTSDDDEGRDYPYSHKDTNVPKSGKFAPFRGIRQSFLYVFLPMAVFARDMGIRWQWLNNDLEAIFVPQHQRNQYQYRDRTTAANHPTQPHHHHLRTTSTTTTTSPASHDGNKKNENLNDDTSVTEDNNPTEHDDDDIENKNSSINLHHHLSADPLQL